jgi:predicted metal-dependent hydrolase
MDAPVFATGIERFNRGEFFAAHEAFEEQLDHVEGDDRWELLVALIQVSVGYHKVQSGHAGAARMLGLGLEKLEPFTATAWGIDVGALQARVRDDLARLEIGEALGARLTEMPPRIEAAGGV